MLRIATAAIVTILSFMCAQVVIGAQRTLYEAGDLDLLLSSPLPEKRALEAKLLGLAGSVTTTFAFLLLPIVIPISILAFPRLLAIVPVLGGLALIGASIGTGLAILLVRLIGARGARATGQVLAAFLGALVFLLAQLASHRDEVPRGGRMGGFIAWMRETGLGGEGWSSWPARAALGDPIALILFLAFAAALFTGTSFWFRRHFLASYQKAGERKTRRAPAGGGGPRRGLFAGGLLRRILAKEVRLLLRQPELLFMMVLRLIYLAPLILFGLGAGGRTAAMALPGLAAVGAVAAGQLTGSIAWLTISAEDAPDLLAVSPVDPARLRRMKLLAALVIVAPIALVVPLILAGQKPAAAPIAFAGAMAAGYGAGLIELWFGKPQKRSTFARRQQGSFIVSIAGILVTMFFGVLTAAAVYFV
jgi:ABC-2 type transport system permease protein